MGQQVKKFTMPILYCQNNVNMAKKNLLHILKYLIKK